LHDDDDDDELSLWRRKLVKVLYSKAAQRSMHRVDDVKKGLNVKNFLPSFLPSFASTSSIYTGRLAMIISSNVWNTVRYFCV